MQRRRFIALSGAALASGGLSLAGCTTTAPSTSGTPDADPAPARIGTPVPDAVG